MMRTTRRWVRRCHRNASIATIGRHGAKCVNAAEPKFVKQGIGIVSWDPPSVAMNPETAPDRD
jgi:hypothetical protein